MKQVLIGFCCLFFANMSAAQSIEGVYVGQMWLTDGELRQIPLAVSLAFTGEFEETPDGEERQIIDGAFVVDDEGGTYAFSKVNFDFIDASIDLRYHRRISSQPGAPATFRLVGHLDQHFHIAGRVLSGQRGEIGRFELAPSEQGQLPRQVKYGGQWQGFAQMTGGGSVPMTIVMEDTAGTTDNPENAEFDYTPGKIGYLLWNQTAIHFSTITIDYLRRQVLLTRLTPQGAVELSIELTMDFDDGSVSGAIYSARRGRTAVFSLPRSNQEMIRLVEDGDSGIEIPPTEPFEVVNGFEFSVAHGADSIVEPEIAAETPIVVRQIRLRLGGAHCGASVVAVHARLGNQAPFSLRPRGAGVFDNHYLAGAFEFDHLQLVVRQSTYHMAKCRLDITGEPYAPLPPPRGARL